MARLKIFKIWVFEMTFPAYWQHYSARSNSSKLCFQSSILPFLKGRFCPNRTRCFCILFCRYLRLLFRKCDCLHVYSYVLGLNFGFSRCFSSVYVVLYNIYFFKTFLWRPLGGRPVYLALNTALILYKNY